MNFKELTRFINKHNEMVCHITTWQTWGELHQPAVELMFKLADKDYIHDTSNEGLWKTYKKCIWFEEELTTAFKSRKTANLKHIVEKYNIAGDNDD